jgi:hypothetical protein
VRRWEEDVAPPCSPQLANAARAIRWLHHNHAIGRRQRSSRNTVSWIDGGHSNLCAWLTYCASANGSVQHLPRRLLMISCGARARFSYSGIVCPCMFLAQNMRCRRLVGPDHLKRGFYVGWKLRKDKRIRCQFMPYSLACNLCSRACRNLVSEECINDTAFLSSMSTLVGSQGSLQRARGVNIALNMTSGSLGRPLLIA